MAIFPANNADLVQQLIDVTHDKPDPNRPIRIEVGREDSGKPAAYVYGKIEAENEYLREPDYCCFKSILCRSYYLGPVYMEVGVLRKVR